MEKGNEMICPICHIKMEKVTPGISVFYVCPKCGYSKDGELSKNFFTLLSQNDKFSKDEEN